jgi:hypothetical protein
VNYYKIKYKLQHSVFGIKKVHANIIKSLSNMSINYQSKARTKASTFRSNKADVISEVSISSATRQEHWSDRKLGKRLQLRVKS